MPYPQVNPAQACWARGKVLWFALLDFCLDWDLAVPTFILLTEVSTKYYHGDPEAEILGNIAPATPIAFHFSACFPRCPQRRCSPLQLPRALHPTARAKRCYLTWTNFSQKQLKSLRSYLPFTRSLLIKIVTQMTLNPKALRCKGNNWPTFFPSMTNQVFNTAKATVKATHDKKRIWSKQDYYFRFIR